MIFNQKNYLYFKKIKCLTVITITHVMMWGRGVGQHIVQYSVGAVALKLSNLYSLLKKMKKYYTLFTIIYTS